MKPIGDLPQLLSGAGVHPAAQPCTGPGGSAWAARKVPAVHLNRRIGVAALQHTEGPGQVIGFAEIDERLMLVHHHPQLYACLGCSGCSEDIAE